MGGMSLITKELVEPWFLPKRRVAAAALTIFIDVKLRTAERDLAINNLNVGSNYEKVVSFLKTSIRSLFFPFAMLVDWLTAWHLVDKLVLDGKDQVYQYGDDLNVGLYLDNPFEGDIPTCPVCQELMGKLGEQNVVCKYHNGGDVVLKMTDNQIQEMKNEVISTDSDPSGLAAVKARCAAAMPVCGFEQKVKMQYIRAGPGCGKSYIIRQMATPSDLVLAPFNKLRPDYVDLITEHGDKYDLLFKTTHRAMETRGCKRIFVDEFTSMRYEYLCCLAHVNGAEEIILVGDEKQTKVQEPDEGLYIGNYVTLDKLPVHELLVNFRNPIDTVAMLNKVYGYKMRAHSKIERSIEFVSVEDSPRDLVAVKMAFSSNSAKLYTENEKHEFLGLAVKRMK